MTENVRSMTFVPENLKSEQFIKNCDVLSKITLAGSRKTRFGQKHMILKIFISTMKNVWN